MSTEYNKKCTMVPVDLLYSILILVPGVNKCKLKMLLNEEVFTVYIYHSTWLGTWYHTCTTAHYFWLGK